MGAVTRDRAWAGAPPPSPTARRAAGTAGPAACCAQVSATGPPGPPAPPSPSSPPPRVAAPTLLSRSAPTVLRLLFFGGARRRGGYARGEATASVSSHPRPPPQAPCPPSRGSPALGVRGTPAAPGILAPAAVVRRVAPAAPTCAGRSGWPCAAGRRP